VHVLDTCDDDDVPLFTEKTLKGAGGVVVPRVLAVWFDREGSRGGGYLCLGCHWHARRRGDGPGALAEKSSRGNIQ
jgi:hypothetical protein